MKRILTNLLLAAAVVTSGLGLVSPAAFAQTTNDAKANICAGISATGGNCTDKGSGVTSAVTTIINILAIAGGVIAVIMIIIGGLKYITSGGDSSKVSSAKNTIIYSIVGLVVIALARVIVQYVLGHV